MRLAADLIFLLSAASVVYGVWLMHEPSACIVGGCAGAAAAWLADRGSE